jgi:hypothetical protein
MSHPSRSGSFLLALAANAALAGLLEGAFHPFLPPVCSCWKTAQFHELEERTVLVILAHEAQARRKSEVEFQKPPCPANPVQMTDARLRGSPSPALYSLLTRQDRLCVRIDRQGRVREVRLPGGDSRQAALLATELRQARFWPAVSNGRAVASWSGIRADRLLLPR